MTCINRQLTYSDYLRLDDLLRLQHPVGEPDSFRSLGETFFIVAHQASELWLKSVLLELSAIDRALIARRPLRAEPLNHARRAVAGAEMLVANMQALARLDAETFHSFRRRLGTASGAESVQFAELRVLLGVGIPDGGPIEHHLCEAFRWQVSARNGSAESARGDYQLLVGQLLELGSAIWRWGVWHLDVTQRLLGGRRGTAGTSGASYLAERLLERPFPTLTETVEEKAAGEEAAPIAEGNSNVHAGE